MSVSCEKRSPRAVDGRGAARGRAQVGRRELPRVAGRQADDRVLQADCGRKPHFDHARGQHRRLHRHRVGEVEAAHVAPRHGDRVGAGRQEHAPAPRGRIEIGEERREPRRAGEESRDAAIRAGRVALAERDVAVRVDEAARLRGAVEGEREGHVERRRVVVFEHEPRAQRRPEGAIGAGQVVAAAVGGEAERDVTEIERVRARDEIAAVLEHRDLADVLVVDGQAGVERLGEPLGAGRLVRPEQLRDGDARVAVESRPRFRPAAVFSSSAADVAVFKRGRGARVGDRRRWTEDCPAGCSREDCPLRRRRQAAQRTPERTAGRQHCAFGSTPGSL